MARDRTDLTVYGSGKVRLPTDFSHDEVIVEYRLPRTLVIRPAREGEVGLKTYRPRYGKSTQIRGAVDAIRRLGIALHVAAGSYEPVRLDDAIEVNLRTEEDDGGGGSPGV